MNENQFEELLALRWKRRLNEAEQMQVDAWLASHPAERARWEAEVSASRAFHELPTTPALSNFMARVWQQIDQEERRAAPGAARWPGWLRWPSLAQQFAVLALVCALTAMLLHERRARTPAQLARSVEQVAPLARVPDLAWLKDFEAISRLSQPGADLELLAAFEQTR